MHHRKKEHSETVPKCRNDYGTCQFGITKCWFNHDEHQAINTENHNEKDVIDKLFNIVEQCTERIVQLENKTESDK